MRSYITKPKSIKKNEILNKFCSFLPNEHRQVFIINKNQKPIFDLTEFEGVGEQIDTTEYLNFESNFSLLTISCMNDLIIDDTRGEKVSPMIYKKSSKKLKKGDIVISRNASLGKIALINKDKKIILNGGLSFLRIKKEYKWYFFSFFITNYGSEFLTCLTSGGGTQQNAKRQNLLDVKIPFPTVKNNKNPKDVEKLVSLIVQNILDKEEGIKAKNEMIDSLIDKELRQKQKKNNFSYSYPKISEIKKELRVDTGLYEREYKKFDNLIKNYINGSFPLLNKYSANRGQNLQISQIGESIYSNTAKKNFYRLLTNTELTDLRTISNFRYLGNKNELDIIPENTIVLSADGTIGRCVFIDSFKNTTTNIHPWIINKINPNNEIFDSIFIACFLSFLKGKNFYEKIKDKANGGGIKYGHLRKYIKIPNFSEKKQKEIAREYYNPQDKNSDLTQGNYLDKERVKNSKSGIFQLNMEIFALRDILEDLVDKIINEDKIEINFEY